MTDLFPEGYLSQIIPPVKNMGHNSTIHPLLAGRQARLCLDESMLGLYLDCAMEYADCTLNQDLPLMEQVR